jgi:hypothetical protein
MLGLKQYGAIILQHGSADTSLLECEVDQRQGSIETSPDISVLQSCRCRFEVESRRWQCFSPPPYCDPELLATIFIPPPLHSKATTA